MEQPRIQRAEPDRADPSGTSPRSGSPYGPVDAAQRVALFSRALQRGEQPAYAVAGLLDDFHALQVDALRGMAPPATYWEPS